MMFVVLRVFMFHRFTSWLCLCFTTILLVQALLGACFDISLLTYRVNEMNLNRVYLI